jgi:hypothetical protein
MVAVVCFLAAFAADRVARTAVGSPGIDFIYFWAVGKVRAAAEGPIGTPYREPERYEQIASNLASASSDTNLEGAMAWRRGRFEPFGTPLCYTASLLLPRSYTLGLRLFQVAQIVAFLLSVLVISRALGSDPSGSWALSLALAGFFGPFLSDLRVGNLNTLQLAFFAGILGWPGLAGEGSREPRAAARGSTAAPTVLLAAVLLKPNVALIALALAAALALHRDGRTRRSGWMWGAATGVVLVALPCLALGSARVWLDWASRLGGLAEPKYGVERGNASLTLALSDTLGLSRTASMAWVVAFLLASLATALARGRRGAASPKPRWGSDLLGDPWFAVAASTTATLALSPLVWLHYFVFALLPSLWLLFSRSWAARLCGVLALLLASEAVRPALSALLGEIEASLAPWSCVPLWIGCVLSLTRHARS